MEVLLNGKSRGRQTLYAATFLSKSTMHKYTLGKELAGFKGSDANVANLADIMRSTAMNSGNVKYAVGREGIDLIYRPDTISAWTLISKSDGGYIGG